MMLALRLPLIDLFEWMKDHARVRRPEKREVLKTLPYYRRVRI
jgi:hypothetical protein